MITSIFINKYTHAALLIAACAIMFATHTAFAQFPDTTYSQSGYYNQSSYTNYESGNPYGYSQSSYTATPVALAVGADITTTANVNVRESASLAAYNKGTQTNGALGAITSGPKTSDGYTWWYVDFKTGVDGWVVSNYLTVRTASTYSQSAYSTYSQSAYSTNPSTGDGHQVKTTSKVNVRSGASLASYIKGIQLSGAVGNKTTGPVAKDGYNWWLVDFATGVDGWVVGSYLVNTPVTNPTVATIEKFTANPSTIAVGAKTELSWVSVGTSFCSIFETTFPEITPTLVKGDLSTSGSYSITPFWDTTSKTYMLRCQDASTLKDKVVEATTKVTRKNATVSDEAKVTFKGASVKTSNDGTEGTFVITFNVASKDEDILLSRKYLGDDNSGIETILNGKDMTGATYTLAATDSIKDDVAATNYFTIKAGTNRSFKLTGVQVPDKTGEYKMQIENVAVRLVGTDGTPATEVNATFGSSKSMFVTRNVELSPKAEDDNYDVSFHYKVEGLKVTGDFKLMNGCEGYAITWGDGSKMESKIDESDSEMCTQAITEVKPTHTYAKAGSYTLLYKRYVGSTLISTDTFKVTLSGGVTKVSSITNTNTENPTVAGTSDGMGPINFWVTNSAGATVYKSGGLTLASNGTWSHKIGADGTDLTPGTYELLLWDNYIIVEQKPFTITSGAVLGAATSSVDGALSELIFTLQSFIDSLE